MDINWQVGKPKGELSYCVSPSPFGPMLLAWTDESLYYLGFTNSLDDITERWPQIHLTQADDIYTQTINSGQLPPLTLYGTPFQHKVWHALLDIPGNETKSYGQIAQAIGKPTAQRAVASAIGQNPISLLVPCHRVLRSTGELGGYHWGLEIKRQILDTELRGD